MTQQDRFNTTERDDLDPAADENFEMRDNPDDNVDMDGDCIVPSHPESVRMNTGAPCDDHRKAK